ncbi:MAG: universal stress protein [Actinomycetaceae bacterium]|nr:universal stress protein [Actinomycetaceae bacterium]
MSVVLSYHGKPESDAALQLAIRAAKQRGTDLTIVVASRMSADDERTEMDAHDRLWTALESCGVPFQVRNASGNEPVAETLLDVAGEINAALIVLGLRRGGYGSVNLGVNASRVLLDAPCPVLTTTEFER